jgi:hypothetical protein
MVRPPVQQVYHPIVHLAELDVSEDGSSSSSEEEVATASAEESAPASAEEAVKASAEEAARPPVQQVYHPMVRPPVQQVYHPMVRPTPLALSEEEASTSSEEEAQPAAPEMYETMAPPKASPAAPEMYETMVPPKASPAAPVMYDTMVPPKASPAAPLMYDTMVPPKAPPAPLMYDTMVPPKAPVQQVYHDTVRPPPLALDASSEEEALTSSEEEAPTSSEEEAPTSSEEEAPTSAPGPDRNAATALPRLSSAGPERFGTLARELQPLEASEEEDSLHSSEEEGPSDIKVVPLERRADLRKAREARKAAAAAGGRWDKQTGGWRRVALPRLSDADAEDRAWLPAPVDSAADRNNAAPERRFGMRQTYAGEHADYNATDDVDRTRYDVRTRYDDDKQRRAHGIGAKDGLLHRANGKQMDTRKAGGNQTSGTGGREIFALDRDRGGDQLYAADTAAESAASLARANKAAARGKRGVYERTHHSTFTGGQSVLAAGEMSVKKGWLQRLSNDSGHYRPDRTSNLQALRALDKMGVNLDATKVDNLTFDDDNKKTTETYQARAVLATGNDTELMKAHQRTFAGIRDGGAGLKHREAPAARDDWWREAYREEGHNPAELMKAHQRTFAGIRDGGAGLKHREAPAAGDDWWKEAYREEGHNPVQAAARPSPKKGHHKGRRRGSKKHSGR